MTELIEWASATLRTSQRLRVDAAELRADAKALRNALEQPARITLRDFVAGMKPVEVYAGLSLGSVCQGCLRTIAAGEVEFYLAIASSALRLDPQCFCVAVDLRAFTQGHDDLLEEFNALTRQVHRSLVSPPEARYTRLGIQA